MLQLIINYQYYRLHNSWSNKLTNQSLKKDLQKTKNCIMAWTCYKCSRIWVVLVNTWTFTMHVHYKKLTSKNQHGLHREEVVLQNLHLGYTRKILEKIFQCCHGNILSQQLWSTKATFKPAQWPAALQKMKKIKEMLPFFVLCWFNIILVNFK